ncbi:MAG: peroxidase family protein [Aureispira sp.]
MQHGTMKALEDMKAQGASLNNYDYLFPRDLERLDSNNKEEVIKGLTELGKVMTSKPSEDATNLDAFFTYLGQFIDHDLTNSSIKKELDAAIDKDSFDVVDATADIQELVQNIRTGTMEMDSLYHTAAVDASGRFILGNLEDELGSDGNDLPRDPNKKALIGDGRNDENLAVAQTHVAFLKFHNAIMDKEGVNGAEARKIATQHYQWILIHDFLKAVVDYDYVQQALTFGNRFFRPTIDNFFLPLEFTMAAFRLGHSMVRDAYDWNIPKGELTLRDLFDSGDLGGQLPPSLNRKIDWKVFTTNKSKKLDSSIVDPLANIPNININLAVRNLRRGYMFGLPTGQAVAEAILFDHSLVLSAEELLGHATPEERAVLEPYNFHNKTPLWYYILKEAEIRARGEHLGPVGTAIVTEVFLASIQLSPFSILKETNWRPTLAPHFDFREMLRYTGLLEPII